MAGDDIVSEDDRRDRLQRAYNALYTAERSLESIGDAAMVRYELGELRERLGFIAFPGAGQTTEVG